MKPNNGAEELIIARTITANQARKKLHLVRLSTNVIQSRIVDLYLDILEQVISLMKASFSNLSHLDEVIVVSRCSQLIALVVYVHNLQEMRGQNKMYLEVQE